MNDTLQSRIGTGVGAVAFVGGLAVWTASLFWGGDPARVWRAVLISFLFFTPLAAGLVVWPAIIRLSRGTWAGEVERSALSSIGFAIPSLLALAALALSSKAWAPWWNPAALPQGVWLWPPFLFARDGAVLAVFWTLAWGYVRRPGQRSAILLIVGYLLTFSLLGFDLVMALDPLWSSELFGGYFVISGLFGAMAAWTFIGAWVLKSKADTLHDLGRLTLTFSILTSYLMYSQLLPIWYENLRDETRFIIPRMHGDWGWVSVVLLMLVYIGPIGALLTIRGKRVPWLVGSSASLILMGLWVERLWLVQPVFHPQPVCGVPELSMVAAFWGAIVLCRTFSINLPVPWCETNSPENAQQ